MTSPASEKGIKHFILEKNALNLAYLDITVDF